MGSRAKPLEDRFWAKVQKGSNDECWLWMGAMTREGYGRIARDMAHVRGRAPLQAHRVSWEIAYGKIDPGLHIHHRCENPSCVNPAHLEAIPHGVHRALHAAAQREQELLAPVAINGVTVDGPERERLLAIARFR